VASIYEVDGKALIFVEGGGTVCAIAFKEVSKGLARKYRVYMNCSRREGGVAGADAPSVYEIAGRLYAELEKDALKLEMSVVSGNEHLFDKALEAVYKKLSEGGFKPTDEGRELCHRSNVRVLVSASKMQKAIVVTIKGNSVECTTSADLRKVAVEHNCRKRGYTDEINDEEINAVVDASADLYTELLKLLGQTAAGA